MAVKKDQIDLYYNNNMAKIRVTQLCDYIAK